MSIVDPHAITLLTVDPQFDPVRDDPRFDAFLRRVGLPPHKRSELLELERGAKN